MRKEKDLKRPTFKLVELDIFENYDLTYKIKLVQGPFCHFYKNAVIYNIPVMGFYYDVNV